jgi:hypothetical protein
VFTHMEPVRKDEHQVRGSTYVLDVYKVIETGEHRVYISKEERGLEMLATASADVVSDGDAVGVDVVEILIQAARDEIDRNERGNY